MVGVQALEQVENALDKRAHPDAVVFHRKQLSVSRRAAVGTTAWRRFDNF
jgi:hypothetical protein